MLDRELVEYVWANFCNFIFPREVGLDDGEHFNRVNVANLNELCQTVWGNLDKNVYVSVYSESMIKDGYVNCIFFDLDDSNDLEKPYNEMLNIVSFFQSNFNYVPRVNFSGKKGAHIYVDIPPVKLNDIRMSLRRLYKNLFSGYKTLDTSVIGDKRRVSRLPYTIHRETKRYCVPIEAGWSLDKILEESINPDARNGIRLTRNVAQCREIAFALEALDRNVQSGYDNKTYPTKLTYDRIKRYSEEVDTLLCNIASKVDNGRHRYLHYMLVPRLYILGKSEQEIFDTAQQFVNNSKEEGNRGWGHYEPYVRDSIRRTREGNWMPWSFTTFYEYFPDLAFFIEESK